ncbi:MAG: AraC family transcriptional regulator [Clostridia bacterium]|nr:AraC family transcriptional regulator [Clostridia bacterium]
MKKYLDQHRAIMYLPEREGSFGITKYQNRYGWTDCYIGNKLLFSHRKTVYDLDGFPETLHSHTFYELDIYLQGNISYIADNKEFTPSRDDIVLFLPGSQHTARLIDDGVYERYVFYFSPELLDFLHVGYLDELFKDKKTGCYYIQNQRKAEFYYFLENLNRCLKSNDVASAALAMTSVTQILIIAAQHTAQNLESIGFIPQNVLDIKAYIDKNFFQLNTATQIAEHFFYSREYVSRLFKQHYNMNLSEYLVGCKIQYAKKLLENGSSVLYTCNTVGFKSMSAFINAFKENVKMTPAKYKKFIKQRF